METEGKAPAGAGDLVNPLSDEKRLGKEDVKNLLDEGTVDVDDAGVCQQHSQSITN